MLTSDFAFNQKPSPESLHVLRRFIRKHEQPAPVPARPSEERCEMCAEPLASEHRHMLDLVNSKLLCACQACSLLFVPREANESKYRLIPQRALALPDFQMTDEQWNELMLPVNMVYIFHSSQARRAMAFYPSPAGATESQLDLEHWNALLQANPILNEMEPDVEALLINRVEQTRAYYLVPIDACYHLVGLLRSSWKGLSGGKEVWEAIAAFFARLQTQASPARSINPQELRNAQRPGQRPEMRKGEDDASTRSAF